MKTSSKVLAVGLMALLAAVFCQKGNELIDGGM